MNLELDHLFILCARGGPEAELLLDSGFTEAASNRHQGQGTSNRLFVFDNFKLELMWVDVPEEARSELVRPLHLWERWQQRESAACPFGICLRSVANSKNTHLPFSHWQYMPSYLPSHLSIEMGANADNLNEPLVFKTPFAYKPDVLRQAHRNGCKKLTALHVGMHSSNAASPALNYVGKLPNVSLSNGERYTIELIFDDAAQGLHKDFFPQLPLTIHY